LDSVTPYEAATHLGGHGICAWSGNFYALSLTERLGVEEHGGLLRLGLDHYNTAEEVDRVLKELASIA
jgi:selenocysteine lyase/cysteine desulfurase